MTILGLPLEVFVENWMTMYDSNPIRVGAALSHCITVQSDHVSITVVSDRHATTPIALAHEALFPNTLLRNTVTTNTIY